jgi:dipeptide/tripeptide permease
MIFQQKVILLVILFIVFTIAEYMIRRKLKLPRQPFFSMYRPLNNLHKWLERSILIALIISFLVANEEIRSYVFIVLILFLQLFRMFMEWKYNREEKEYIMNGVGVIFFSILIGIIVNI